MRQILVFVFLILFSGGLVGCKTAGATAVTVRNETAIADTYARDAQATEYARNWNAEIARRTLIAADSQSTRTAVASTTAQAVAWEQATRTAIAQATQTAMANIQATEQAKITGTQTMMALNVEMTSTAVAVQVMLAEQYSARSRARLWNFAFWAVVCIGVVFIGWVGFAVARSVMHKLTVQAARQDLPDGQNIFVFPERGGKTTLIKPSLLLNAGTTILNTDYQVLETAETALAMATMETQARVLLGVAGKSAGTEISERIGEIAARTPLPGSGKPGQTGQTGQSGRGQVNYFAQQGSGAVAVAFDYLREIGITRADVLEIIQLVFRDGGTLARAYLTTHTFESGLQMTRGQYDALMTHWSNIGIVTKHITTGGNIFARGLDERKIRNMALRG